jgi:glycosyltransferase involved in cell wall biosynthesis
VRILIISNYYPPFEIGGWEQLTADVAAMLKERGHSLWVLTSRFRVGELPEEERGTTRGVERILHLESPDHLHYNPKYTLFCRLWERQNRRFLARRIAAFSPEVVFINSMWNLPRSLAREAEKLCPGRVVYYMASPWPAEPDAHTAYWQLPANHPTRHGPKRLLRAIARRWLLPDTARNRPAFGHVLCVSDYMRRFLAEQAGIPLENSQVVYNGVDPAAFTPHLSPSPNGRKKEFRLLYAGQLRPDKGVHTAIEAVGRAVQADPALPVKMTIYGGGPPGYTGQLRERIEALNLSQTISLAGQIPREQMPEVMAGHDVLLFPSIWPEPLARVVQEAMAAGLVVIGTTTGGTPELLQDGKTGLTFEAEDAAMLAGQIGRLAGDPALFDRLSKAARQTVETCFTQERMVDEIEAYFHYLLHEQSKSPELNGQFQI